MAEPGAGIEFSNAVRGVVVPILAMFDSSGSLDEPAIAEYVEFLINSGVSTLMCTVGTSRYDVLTVPEMLRVNEIVTKAADGRATVIVTTPSTGPTTQAIEFAEAASKSGADAIIAVYPDRYYGDEPIARFFEDVCRATDTGVMIHEMPIRAGRAFEAPSVQYSTRLVERFLRCANAVGLKEESADPETIKQMNRHFADHCAVVGGRGGMAAHLAAREHGQVAYLASIGNFAPTVELQFSKLVAAGNCDEAQAIITQYEKPFFDIAVNLGWHLALREAMAMAGLCPPFERQPMLRLTSEDRRKLEAVTEKITLFGEACNQSGASSGR
ncbi:MAG: dihydrodipicolinate synthase family protein [Betaproteobacteria bacterium]|nr:MAG: dihydrodipicolinate synthase family protein [Betaproteobacteria bacterium]